MRVLLVLAALASLAACAAPDRTAIERAGAQPKIGAGRTAAETAGR